MCAFINDWKCPSRSTDFTGHDAPVYASNNRRRNPAIAFALIFAGRYASTSCNPPRANANTNPTTNNASNDAVTPTGPRSTDTTRDPCDNAPAIAATNANNPASANPATTDTTANNPTCHRDPAKNGDTRLHARRASPTTTTGDRRRARDPSREPGTDTKHPPSGQNGG